jgi:hypothetical protein
LGTVGSLPAGVVVRQFSFSPTDVEMLSSMVEISLNVENPSLLLKLDSSEKAWIGESMHNHGAASSLLRRDFCLGQMPVQADGWVTYRCSSQTGV